MGRASPWLFITSLAPRPLLCSEKAPQLLVVWGDTQGRFAGGCAVPRSGGMLRRRLESVAVATGRQRGGCRGRAGMAASPLTPRRPPGDGPRGAPGLGGLPAASVWAGVALVGAPRCPHGCSLGCYSLGRRSPRVCGCTGLRRGLGCGDAAVVPVQVSPPDWGCWGWAGRRGHLMGIVFTRVLAW